MNRKADIRAARKRAADVVSELGIKQPPIDLQLIVSARGIDVFADECLGDAFSGCLLRAGDTFGIVFSSKIPNLGFQRFTIAHELGHFHLTHQHEFIFGKAGKHSSSSGFISYDWCEVEADHFAAELLMPEAMVRSVLRSAGVGLSAVKALANRFETSLTSSAIRFAELSYDPVGIIVSVGKNIQYCFVSDALSSRIPNVAYALHKNDPLPICVPTAKFNLDHDGAYHTDVCNDSSYLAEWFPDCGSDMKVQEDIVGLGSYGRTLTILFADEVPDDSD